MSYDNYPHSIRNIVVEIMIINISIYILMFLPCLQRQPSIVEEVGGRLHRWTDLIQTRAGLCRSFGTMNMEA